MRTTYEEQLKKLEAKRAAIEARMIENQNKKRVLSGTEKELTPAVNAFKEVVSKMGLPEKNVLDGLAKAILGSAVLCTFRMPRGARRKAAKPRKKA